MVTNKLIQEFRKRIDKNCEFSVKNVFFFQNGKVESDIIEVTKAGYAVEYEVKVSRSDYLADKIKDKWYLYNRYPNRSPKYFYYLSPKGIICSKEIPYFAGLIEYDGTNFKKIKSPKIISRARLTFKEKYSLLMKLYYKSIPSTFDPRYQKS